jgi:tRNA(adenine34) deaminase
LFTLYSFREKRSCNKGRDQKLLEREVTQARQVWRHNEDYECECDRSELIERDLRRKEKSLEPRVARIEEYYDYWEIDNCRRRDDNSRNLNQRRRHDCECDCEDHKRRRLPDRRGRRDEYDSRFSDRRRRAGCDDCEDNERIRLSDQRRRRDEHDDKIKFYDQRRRAAYDDYDEGEDVRNREDRIRVSGQRRMEGYDLKEVDDYARRRADQIKFTDQRRRDEYCDYDEEDKIRVSDRRRRGDYNERTDNIGVPDWRKDEDYDYGEEDYRRRREDRIRVSDQRGREVYDEKDNTIRVSDRRRRDECHEFDEEDRAKVSDRRRSNGYYDYDNEDNIRVSDQRRRDMHYDFNGEDKVRVSGRRRNDGYYHYDNEDNIRISDRRRSDRHHDYENEDEFGVSDRRRRNVYYDFDGEDKVTVSDQRRKEVCDGRDNSLRVMDTSRRDEKYDYGEEDRIRISDRRRRDEDYDYNEEDKIRVFDQKRKEVLSKKDSRINNSDHRIGEEADDYEEVLTSLQQMDGATRVSDSKLERPSRFKENKDEASTSWIRQTEEGKYRVEREQYDRKNSREGSQIVKIISEDNSSLVSRERKNAVNMLTTSDAQLNLQSKAQIGMQRQSFDSSTLVQSQIAVQKDKNNTLNQFTGSEVETDMQNRTHISAGRKQVDTSSSVQNQIQVMRDKKNIVNQLALSETELDLQLRSDVDVQRTMVDASSIVQNVSQVATDKKNLLNQFTVTAVESDLQNRTQIEAERKRVNASTSVQNVAEFTKRRHNIVNQLTVSEAESYVQNKNRLEAERRIIDASTSVQNMTQVVRDKHNIVNQLTMSEVELNVQNINQIEAEKRRVGLDTSVQNATQLANERQNIFDQLAVSAVESDVQNRSRIDAERRVADMATTLHDVTQVTKEKSNVVNQLMLHESEVNVLNKTDVNLTRVNVNDANTPPVNLSTDTGSGTSTSLIQATGSSSERVGSSSLAAGSSPFKGSLESASRLEKSSSYHIGQFMDSVHEDLLGESAKKGPSENLWDLKSSGSHGTSQAAAGGSTETENNVTRRHGKSLWAFVADIIKLGFLKGEDRQLKSGGRSSSSDSRGTDDWFSGQEEMDPELKNDEKNKDEQPLVEHPPEVDSSALVKVPEVDLSVTDDGTVIPTLQEKTVIEEDRGHKITPIIGEADNLNISATCGVNASGVAGITLHLGEKIVMEEMPTIAKPIVEKNTKSGYSIDMLASVGAGEINTNTAASGSMSEVHVSRVTETGERSESRRGKQLKRIMQVPKSSFDEWEEEHSAGIETPAIESTGETITEVLASGVAEVPATLELPPSGIASINTSLGTATMEFLPSGVAGYPSVSASSTSMIPNLHTTGDPGIEAAGGLKREKQLKRIAQVQNKSIDEYKETKAGERATIRSDSTIVTAELPESGAVEGHEIVDKGGRKHLRRLSQAPKESYEEWEEAYIREKEQRRLDEFFMREALVEAQRASDSWEVPVGAVLVRNGEVIARGCNL